MFLRNDFGWYILTLHILIYCFCFKDANEYNLRHTDQQHSDKQYCNDATWIKIWGVISYQTWLRLNDPSFVLFSVQELSSLPRNEVWNMYLTRKTDTSTTFSTSLTSTSSTETTYSNLEQGVGHGRSVDGSFEHDPSENQLHTDESSIRTLVRFYVPFGIRLHVVSLCFRCFAVLLLIWQGQGLRYKRRPKQAVGVSTQVLLAAPRPAQWLKLQALLHLLPRREPQRPVQRIQGK